MKLRAQIITNEVQLVRRWQVFLYGRAECPGQVASFGIRHGHKHLSRHYTSRLLAKFKPNRELVRMHVGFGKVRTRHLVRSHDRSDPSWNRSSSPVAVGLTGCLGSTKFVWLGREFETRECYTWISSKPNLDFLGREELVIACQLKDVGLGPILNNTLLGSCIES